MPASKLASALQGIDWNASVGEFLTDAKAVAAIANANLRIAIWSRQFEIADSGNPVLSFIRGMQAASQQVPVVTALALYPVAASAMRGMLDNALHYSFFRTHLTELRTLVRDPLYFIDKKVVSTQARFDYSHGQVVFDSFIRNTWSDARNVDAL